MERFVEIGIETCIEVWSSRIRASWQKAVGSIIETGKLLSKAKKEIGHGNFEEMVKMRLPFGIRVAEMLMKIASHPILRNPKFVSDLPPSYRTLYALSRIPPRELDWMIEEGKVHSELKFSQTKALGCYDFEQAFRAMLTIMNFKRAEISPHELADEWPLKGLMSKEPDELASLTAYVGAISDAIRARYDRECGASLVWQ